MLEWFRSNPVLTGWIFAISAAICVASMIALPLMVTRIREDYFLTREPPSTSWTGRHPVVRIAAIILKNLLGAVLVMAGVAMLVLPGQGVLTMLLGISLLDFPGKRRLELRIVRQRPVLHTINWFRARAGRPPLRLPPPKGSDPSVS